MSFIERPMVWLVMSKSSQISVCITSQYFQFSWIILKSLPCCVADVFCALVEKFLSRERCCCRVRPSHSIGEEIWRDDWMILQLLSIWTCQNVSECATMDVLIWPVWTVDFLRKFVKKSKFQLTDNVVVVSATGIILSLNKFVSKLRFSWCRIRGHFK